jgi:6-phosphogluconolactonase (cycloisomerase 2 family)
MRLPLPFLLTAIGTLAACASDTTSSADPAASTALEADAPHAVHGDGGPGALYTLSNAVGGNAVLAYSRRADGSLGAPTAYPTGGTGTGGGLGNQGAVTLTRDGRWLAAVDPGSDEVTLFRVHPRGLTLASRAPSGGDRPISVTLHGDLLYVLNNGGTANITGFRIAPSGDLAPIAGSTRPLSTPAPNASQVQFSPDGSRLVVTEKATNRLVTYAVGHDGVAGPPSMQASSGQTPFGFGFTQQGLLLVSEAFGGAPDASAVSSYRPESGPTYGVVSASVGTTETAACWLVVSQDGRFAYTTNTGSGSISGYAIAGDGSLRLLDADGRTGVTGAGTGPIDAGISRGGRFLYALNGANQTISVFVVGGDGSLAPLATVTGLPAGANGLAVR